MKPVIKKLFIYGSGAIIASALLGIITIAGLYLYLAPKLPDIDTLKDVRLQVPLRVFSRDNRLIAEFGEMRRSPLKYEDFPQPLINAVLAAEDDRFFEHPGVDYRGILRAAFELVKSGGEKRQGGSTITMQVARNFFLSREKTFTRKFNEIFLSLKIEQELSKQDILVLYLNKIFLGNRAYGFAAAAQVYYGKPLSELTLAETAMLAGLPKAPSRYNPVADPQRAVERRTYVLHRMLELGYISQAEYATALAEIDTASVFGQAVEVEAPYVAEMVRTEMLTRYGNEAYTAGIAVYTTIDPALQQAANRALRTALLEYDRRHGYHGHLQRHQAVSEHDILDLPHWQEALSEHPKVGNLRPAIIISTDRETNDAYAYTADNQIAYLPWEQVNWARRHIDENQLGPELNKISDILTPGDVVYVAPGSNGCSWLAQVPRVVGALVTLSPHDGSISALVGGFDYDTSKFNRVTQAERQPGSSFKPFIYAAAIDKGFTAASIINDAPVVFDAPGLEDTWRPSNYSGRIYGETRLREALVKSRNLVSIRILRDIGIGYAVRYTRRFGFENASLPRDLSLALGSGTMTPLDLATGYAVFANGGYRIAPNFIDYLRGPDGSIVQVSNPLRVCPVCIEEEENAEKLAEQTDSAVTDGAETTETASEAPDSPPIEQADSLQAFLVSPDAETSLEDNLRREVQLAEGPPAPLPAPRALTPQTAFIMNSMLRDVIRRGTGVRARELGRNDLAGKTGTTNDQRDAWFAGFNKELVSVAWVGFDNPKPLGQRETGAIAALPMWIDFMRTALHKMPETDLIQPQDLVSVRINGNNGRPTTASDPEAIFEYFLEDQVPAQETGTGSNDGQQPPPPSDITRELF